MCTCQALPCRFDALNQSAAVVSEFPVVFTGRGCVDGGMVDPGGSCRISKHCFTCHDATCDAGVYTDHILLFGYATSSRDLEREAPVLF